jgi:hypothetical protein
MKNEIDEKIKRELQKQSEELDELIDGGLKSYLKLGFESRFVGIMKIGYLLAILFTFLLVWCGYEFFNASSDDQVFWGVCFILSVNIQIAVKLWIFMQTNQNILSKELRLMQLRQNSIG